MSILVEKQVKEKFTSSTVVWVVSYENINRTVTLYHNKLLGKRIINVDGFQVLKQRKLIDSGSFHRILLAFGSDKTIQADVRIDSTGFGFSYNLVANFPTNWSFDDIRW